MYRKSYWAEGYYIDNHKKYVCFDCKKEFIIGEKLSESCAPGFPVCPYCGKKNMECVVWSEDDQLQELASDMGCLAIYVDLCK